MAVKKMFKRVGDPAKLEVKLAPQEVVVFEHIPAKGIERKDLVAALEQAAKDGKLQTKQTPASILGYYTKHLVDSKLIEIERIEEAPTKAEPKEKAAPKAKANAA